MTGVTQPQVQPWLLELLRCPVTGAELEVRDDGRRVELVSTDPQRLLAYPVRDGVPVLLADEARPVD